MKKTSFALCAALGLFAVSSLAGANTITVDSTDDAVLTPSVCTLRSAIKAANGNAVFDTCTAGAVGEDRIVFASGLTGTVTLITDLPQIAESLRIEGPGASALTVDGAGVINTLNYTSGTPGQTYALEGLKITGASQAGINASVCDLSLDLLTVTGNGNGVSFGGAGNLLTIANSSLSGNTATLPAGGGGLFFLGSRLEVSNSTFSGNTIDFGGGIQIAGDLTNCISDACSADLTNVTISDNKTTGDGAGFAMASSIGPFPVTLTHVTIAGNHADTDNSGDIGGGLYVGSNVEVTLKNTLVANNVRGTALTPDDCRVDGGTLATNGFNLVRIPAGCTGLSGTDISGQDPLLGVLADNGGLTKTRLLLDGSPAIDAALLADATPQDQRGAPRPLGDGPDIGAVEVGCGDGLVETGEACDDGNTDDTDACKNDCTLPPAGTTGGTTGGGTAGTSGGTAGTATAGSDDGNGGCSLLLKR